ncbi:hypothetical protein D3C73_1558140 [compost metagenome]
MGSPLKVISPEEGAISPLTMFSRVDFPQPEGPKIVINSPSDSSRFILLRVLTSPDFE